MPVSPATFIVLAVVIFLLALEYSLLTFLTKPLRKVWKTFANVVVLTIFGLSLFFILTYLEAIINWGTQFFPSL